MPTLYVDNAPYEVSAGKNLLETCLTLGFDVPYFCWHPALGSVGACRQCAVKIFKDADDKKGRLIMSCMEPVTKDQRISIDDVEAREFRENVIGWLMTNHPHDCAVCDEGGSCHLQDMTVMTGHAYRKFNYLKRTYQNQYLGPFLNHEMNRCIQCYRCVRFYKDYAGGNDLDVFASRNRVYFGRVEDGVLENEFSGNLAEVCPTGVFTDKTLKQHYTRKWDLTMAPSICQHCSLGCNTIAGERYGTIRMIGNRYHGEVNGYFICDRGRFGYEFVNAETRIRTPHKENGISSDIAEEKLINEFAALKGLKIVGIGSPRASLESNFVLRKLVGRENFYHGVSETEYHLTSLVKRILSSGLRSFSMKEVEKADAVLVLGEDITNTAPMLSLAVRQSVRQKPMDKVRRVKIPEWNDAAVRELIQDEKGPLFIASLAPTRLDDIASATVQDAPDNIARIGFAIAHFIDATAPAVDSLSDLEKNLVEMIGTALMNAACPVVISGTAAGSSSIVEAAANIVLALGKKNHKAGVVYALPACNSIGLSLLDGNPFEKINERSDVVDAVIILENDLFRHATLQAANSILSKLDHIVMIDHTMHDTAKRANLVVPAGTFAESDGTLVNNEGRMQRYFQVYEPSGNILESWRWLIKLGKALEIQEVNDWNVHDDVVHALASEENLFGVMEAVAPGPDFRINGQKIPREPHRYSGRTAMLANVNVSEPKPPEDPDSPMTFTMEGTRTLPPSSAIPFFWSPGWNSVQSVNKYQEEVGAHLKGGDPGKRLFSGEGNLTYFASVPKAFKPEQSSFLVVPLYHIFGSDELSSLSPGIEERSPAPYIGLNEKDALALGKTESQILNFKIDETEYSLPVRVITGLPQRIAGLPIGLRGLAFCSLPGEMITNT